jgi:hypothetical protein
VRISIACVLGGELIALTGLGLWSIAAALLVAGVQLVALGLMRESRAPAAAVKRPTKPKTSVRAGLHRRRTSVTRYLHKRPYLRLVRGVAS